MTFESLKELCDNISVSLNNNLMYYHKELVGRFYFTGHSKFVCDILVIGSPKPVERLDDETIIEQYLIKAIKYFKENEHKQRLKRIENDF
jgi:hypothetical protein